MESGDISFENTEYVVATYDSEVRSIVGILVGMTFAVILVVCSGVLWLLNTPINEFPSNELVTIASGSTVVDIAMELKEQRVVRSVFLFKLLAHLTTNGGHLQAGSYVFPEPLSTQKVVTALYSGTFVAPPLRATFPEGFVVADISTYLPEGFAFTRDTLSTLPEGYLFPDTYFLNETTTAAELITRMQENFTAKLAPLAKDISDSGLTEDEVIVLASIVEREANDLESMRIVAGILLTRLDIGMALQVDATLDYILDKTSAELTEDDLNLDSPYNTYKYPNLPPTPIANPGLMAINAVLNPLPSEYLYYLTDFDGEFHYAKTFEEHKQNKKYYLR